jgi:hypothetical protein
LVIVFLLLGRLRLGLEQQGTATEYQTSRPTQIHSSHIIARSFPQPKESEDRQEHPTGHSRRGYLGFRNARRPKLGIFGRLGTTPVVDSIPTVANLAADCLF